MIAMQLQRIANLSETTTPLQLVTLPEPSPAEDEILIKVSACGVCHTELDEIEGRTPPPELPIIPGHQVVGRIVGMGKQASIFSIGDRVGVAWIYSACGSCEFCLSGRENLCQEFCATGRDINGGYAQYMIAKETFALRIPEVFPDTSAAPLLCAGAVGFRSLRLANIINGQKVGFSGFGASAHIVLQLVRKIFPNSKIFVFTRNPSEQAFALDLGAYWAGGYDDDPPSLLHVIIDTTPAWMPIVKSLSYLLPGGRLVINAIRKEDFDLSILTKINYASHLWQEKEVKSVANVTRQDVNDFLHMAAEIPILPVIQEYTLDEANQALVELKLRKIHGAKVLRIS
jgi:propanol-preferring alcohol dehydrogenase